MRCTTAASATFTPGLTATPAAQKAKLSGSLSGCAGKAGIKIGSITGTLSSPGAIRCANLLQGTVASGTEVLKYKGGTSSTAHVTISVTTTGNFSINGKVTKGRFKGHKVTGAMTLNSSGSTNTGANCSTVAITRINFHGTTTVS